MDNRMFDFRFADMGGNFETFKQLLDFVNSDEHRPELNRVFSPHGTYLTAQTSDGMQIWFQLDKKDETLISDFDVHFKSSLRTKLILEGWTVLKNGGMSGLALMLCDSGDDEFDLNIDIVNAGLFMDYASGEFTAQLSAFARDFRLFSNLKIFKAADTGYAEESLIPADTFSEKYEYDYQPGADVIMTGKIKSVKRTANAHTGVNYWHLIVECMGFKSDVLLSDADVLQEPVEGGYIQGTFYLTARLFPSWNDEYLTPLFALEAGEIANDFPSFTTCGDPYDEPDAGWVLIAYPLLPDKGILLIFQNADENGAGENKTTASYYRFLRYDAQGKLIDARRTRLRRDASVTTALYDGSNHLHIVFCMKDGQAYIYDPDDGADPHPVQSLGENITRIVTDSKGNLYAGRDYSDYREWTGALVSVYNTAGDTAGEFYRRDCFRCPELVLDEEENVLYLTEPILTLCKILTESDSLSDTVSEFFPLSLCDGLAVSAKGSRMFAECEGAAAPIFQNGLIIQTLYSGQRTANRKMKIPFKETMSDNIWKNAGKNVR